MHTIETLANYNKAEAFFPPESVSGSPVARQGRDGWIQEISMETESAKCKGLVGFAMIATGDKTRGLEYTEKAFDIFNA
ncbi:MAG: hypothetical protein IPM81_05110 [Saprospirales bacterium]|nr:hypothetical protein [Saprospirales bacterium]